MFRQIGSMVVLASAIALSLCGCTPAPRTVLSLNQATGVAVLDTSVDRSLEGFHAIVTRSVDADGRPIVTTDITLAKSQSSASAVVAANVELEKVRAQALSESIAAGISAAITATKKP